MPKQKRKLFEESDASNDEDNFKINTEYAKSYDKWRQKEELTKLKAKYGDESLALSDSADETSSSEDDSDAELITEDFEKEFFKTLASLKSKDPKIYNPSVRFFENTPEVIVKTKKSKDRSLKVKDYDRKQILENEGKENESDDGSNDKEEPSDLKEAQDNILKLFSKVDGDGDDTLKVEEKISDEDKNEEYKKWLAGKKNKLDDDEIEKQLKPLKDLWNDPKIDEKDKFIRDFLLHKRYLEGGDLLDAKVDTAVNELSEDEEQIDKQDEFEHKYNFRFEEPDPEFIKRYPRTMENSVRKQDDKRKQKRTEVKERKEKEKQQKMEELRNLRELKRKEIEEKLEKLKEVTGHDNIDLNDNDLEGDFDPEAHDKWVQRMFNEDFYKIEEGDQKPKFPDLDEELEIEKWEDEEEDGDYRQNQNNSRDLGPHCEDEDFNMDCDYNPDEQANNSEDRKKKRKKKSKFAKLVSKPKPLFNPNDKTYAEYLDEYYKLDCEDIIGDIPCRFKYREVVPNNFGLTIEEILAAKDRELNRWCSLKKAVQYRPEHQEKYDVIAFSKKASNEMLKRKILPSIFEENLDGKSKSKVKNETVTSQMVGTNEQNRKQKKDYDQNENGLVDKMKKESKNNKNDTVEHNDEDGVKKNEVKIKNSIKKKTKRKNNENKEILEKQSNEVNDASESSSVSEKKLKKNKKKSHKKCDVDSNIIEKTSVGKNKANKKRKLSGGEGEEKISKKFKQQNIEISDARLKAFGIKPKKYKNKLKYGQK